MNFAPPACFFLMIYVHVCFIVIRAKREKFSVFLYKFFENVTKKILVRVMDKFTCG